MANIEQVNNQAKSTQLVTVNDYLNKNKDLITRALSKTISPERFLAVVNIVMQSPALQGCTQNSLVAAVLQTVQIGLTPGNISHVYYVPFTNKGVKEVQMIVGFKGLVELVNRSKEATVLNAECVFERDQFQYEKGLNPILRHVPAEGNRGEFRGVYAIAKNMLANEKVFVYLDKEEVEKVKRASKAGSSDYSPWKQWFEEMAKKTAVKRLCKLLPLSIEIQEKIATDETVKVSLSPKMTETPDKADWNATDAEVVKEENTKTAEPQQTEQPEHTQTEEKEEGKHLIDVPVGESISEIDFLVNGVEFKSNVGKNGMSYVHVEDTQGQEYYIQKWGAISDNIEGEICTFLLVKVGEYQGKRQYLADKIIVKGK